MADKEQNTDWITVDGKQYVPVDEAAHLAANQCIYGLHGDDHGNSYCPEVRKKDHEIAEMRAEISVAIQLLKKVLEHNSFRTDDGEVIMKNRSNPTEFYNKAWNFVYSYKITDNQ